MLARQHVAENQPKVGAPGESRIQYAVQPLIDLHTDDLRGCLDQQVRQAAGSAADFQHAIIRPDLAGLAEPPHQVSVNEEMLPEPLARTHPGLGQKFRDLAFCLNVLHGE